MPSRRPQFACGEAGARAEVRLEAPEGSKLLSTSALPDGGEKQSFETDESAADLIKHYASGLGGKGWTITRQGATGGATGGGGQLVADRDGQHVALQAGGPTGDTFLTVCVWPKRPTNDYCG